MVKERSRRSDQKEIQRTRRLAQIINWRLQGYTLQRIADSLKQAGFERLDPSYVGQLIKDALHRSISEPLEEMRSLELMRLDELQAAYFQKALAGDAQSADRVLAIIDRRARLTGLNAPQKIEPVAINDEARQSLVLKLEALSRHVNQTNINHPETSSPSLQPLLTDRSRANSS